MFEFSSQWDQLAIVLSTFKGDVMSSLADLATDVDELDAKVDNLIAVVESLKANTNLSAEDQKRLDDAVAALKAEEAKVDTANPSTPAPPAPAP